MNSAPQSGRAIVGRDAELAALDSFLADPDGARGLVLMGVPGIGKTALWEAGIEAARTRGFRVLSTRASEPELSLSFVALSDLLADVEGAALAAMPRPQLRALEVALHRADPGDRPPESLAVSAGFTSAVRLLATRQPLLLAVDDVPWLDSSSEGVLAFAARRLRGHRSRFLLARRTGEPSSLERVFESGGLERLELGPLSLGATRALLSARLGLTLPRRLLRKVFEAAQGNPLFVLELGRMLIDRGAPEITAQLPVPDLVDDLFGERVAKLADPVGHALLAVALSPGLTRTELAALARGAGLEDAIASGLIVVEGNRLHASHPLLAAAARRHASTSQLRELHVGLAQAIADETLRAHHLALASEAPDAELARRVAGAAANAVRRGATHDGIELAEHAFRLTPPGSAEHSARLLDLAHNLAMAGEMQRVTALLEARTFDLPEGRLLARAHLLLGECADHPREQEDHLDRALACCDGDAELRATVLATKATLLGVIRVEGLGEADALAEQALLIARPAGIEVERRALHALAWIRVLRGRPVNDLGHRFSDAPQEFSLYESAIERPAGVQLLFRGHVREARAVFEHLRALAEERGEARSATVMHLQLCETALRAGDVEQASGLLDEWEEWTATEHADSHHSRCRSLLAVLRGQEEDAARWAAQALAESETIGDEWSRLEALRAGGIAALLAHQPERAADSLRTVWEHTRREGIDDPGAFPVAPDLVEALVELGAPGEAEAVTERLAALATEQDHPWGIATTRRCQALLAPASRHEDALPWLIEAAAAYDELGLRFDHARTLLAGGRAARRLTKWGAARRLLEPAVAAFESLGSDGWARDARSELARVGGRKAAAGGGLTPAERRVAVLAAKGLSNKEIAGALVVSVATVETHLKRVYAKLGVRSRAQLGSRLSPEGASAPG